MCAERKQWLGLALTALLSGAIPLVVIILVPGTYGALFGLLLFGVGAGMFVLLLHRQGESVQGLLREGFGWGLALRFGLLVTFLAGALLRVSWLAVIGFIAYVLFTVTMGLLHSGRRKSRERLD